MLLSFNIYDKQNGVKMINKVDIEKLNSNGLKTENLASHKPKFDKSVFYNSTSSFIIPKDVEDPILLKDYNQLTKSEVIAFLKKNIREGYLKHLSQMIEDELFPDVKIIEDLPWK